MTKKTTRRIFFLALIFAMGSLPIYFAQAANPPIDGVLRPSVDNWRYFTNNTGKAIYLTGSNTWANFQDFKIAGNPDFNWADYLRFLEENNHNFIRLWVIGYEYDKSKNVWATPTLFQRTGPADDLAQDGFPKYDLTKFNPDYFNRLRERIVSAGAKGIYVDIMFFDSVGAGYAAMDGTAIGAESAGAWNFHPFNVANNINRIDAKRDLLHTNSAGPGVKDIQRAYVEEVVRQVNTFDNVLFEIGNELPYYSLAWQNELIQDVKNLETILGKKHPIGLTIGGPEGSETYNWKNFSYADLVSSPADWISPPNYNLTDWEYLINPRLPAGNKVSILDTDHLYINDTFVVEYNWVWKSFLRGHNPIYMDIFQVRWPYDRAGQPCCDPVKFASWENSAIPTAVRKAMGHTKTYADKMDLKNMVPIDNNTCASTNYCLRNPGQEYLVYQPVAGSFSVNLPIGTYNPEWFDPKNASTTPGSIVVSSGGNVSFTTPFSGDAVLYLKKNNPADVNEDNFINIKDIQVVIQAIITPPGNPRANVNGDDFVNIKDIQAIITAILAR